MRIWLVCSWSLVPCSLPCTCIVCDSIHHGNWSYLAKLNLKNIVSEDGEMEEEGKGGSEEGREKKKPDARSAGPQVLGQHSDLGSFWIFGWVHDHSAQWPGRISLFCPNLGKEAAGYFKFVVLAIDILLLMTQHPMASSIFPQAPALHWPFPGTFISYSGGMWPFLLSCVPFRAHVEARTIHHLTSELLLTSHHVAAAWDITFDNGYEQGFP